MIAAQLRRCALLAAVTIALPLWLDGCSTGPPGAHGPGTHRAAANPTADSDAAPSNTVTMYVVRRGWHIDVGFAARDLTGPLKLLGEHFPDARFFTFGFGDRRYLHALHADSPMFPHMLAALWPGDGLMLVTALRGTPQQAFGASEVVELTLTARNAAEAQGWMSASLGLQDGHPQSDGPGPYEGSEYWRSSLRYSAVYTCNTWAAEVLSSAGLPLRVHGTVFSGQVWRAVLHLAGSPQAVIP